MLLGASADWPDFIKAFYDRYKVDLNKLMPLTVEKLYQFAIRCGNWPFLENLEREYDIDTSLRFQARNMLLEVVPYPISMEIAFSCPQDFTPMMRAQLKKHFKEIFPEEKTANPSTKNKPK